MIQSHPKRLITEGDFSLVLDTFYVYTGDETDDFVQKYCREYGVWDSDLTHWMIHNIKPGWVCLDVGSNIGYFSELMSRLVGPSGLVMSFEPNSRLVTKHIESTCLNHDINESSEVKIIQKGLSNKNEFLDLIVPSKNIGAANFFDQDYSGDHEKIHVELERLDKIYDGRIDFIKMDIEGYEEFAWEGFPESALNCPLMVFELGPYHSLKFLNKLEEMYDMTDLLGNPVSAKKIKNSKDIEFINTVLKRRAS